MPAHTPAGTNYAGFDCTLAHQYCNTKMHVQYGQYIHLALGWHANTPKNMVILLLLSQGMALSSYSTPMGKVLGIREDMRQDRQTDRRDGETEEQRRGRKKKATQSKYLSVLVWLWVFMSLCVGTTSRVVWAVSVFSSQFVVWMLIFRGIKPSVTSA